MFISLLGVSSGAKNPKMHRNLCFKLTRLTVGTSIYACMGAYLFISKEQRARTQITTKRNVIDTRPAASNHNYLCNKKTNRYFHIMVAKIRPTKHFRGSDLKVSRYCKSVAAKYSTWQRKHISTELYFWLDSHQNHSLDQNFVSRKCISGQPNGDSSVQ